jgi:protein-ribulosamine 3-kinase
MTSWRAARYDTTRLHQTAYHKLVERSHPVEDRDDRNALYALQVFLHALIVLPLPPFSS